MVRLGNLNSRMKDFYDIWRLSRQFKFDDAVLSEAIRQTFENRGTDLMPFNELQADLLENKTLDKQWTAFLSKSGVPGPESFQAVLDQIAAFLGPLFERIAHR